jgi:predicted ArsR family transcriptional regulator
VTVFIFPDDTAWMPTAKALEIHKALADDTRYRLYRFVGLAGRPVSVREVSRRLNLHPNTVRPHLRRLEDAGLVASEMRRGAVGRPQILYSVREPEDEDARDYRLLAEMLIGLVRGSRATAQAHGLAREWGAYLVAQNRPKPGTKPGSPRAPARSLALMQEAMARAGFDPRFRRLQGTAVEVTLRDCPFKDLAEDHRELVCTLHRGLVEGILGALQPPLQIREFAPFADRDTCRIAAG